MSALSNWREEFNLSEVVTGKMTDKEALKKVSEKSGISNKVTINPKLDEAVKEIGGEVISMVEQDTTAQKQRLDMKQMILDRQKLKIRRKDMSAAKQEKKQGVDGDATNASKQANVIAQEGYEEKKTSEVLAAFKRDPKVRKRFEKVAKKEEGPGSVKNRAADSMLQTAKDTAKRKGDTSKSDDRYAYEETNIEVNEGVMKMVKRVMSKKKPEKKAQKAMDAGAIARRKLQQKDHETVNFLPMNEEDKAFKFVLDKIRKEVGKDGYVSKDNPRKPQSAADKAKARAHQAKVDAENSAARAKDPSQGRYPKG